MQARMSWLGFWTAAVGCFLGLSSAASAQMPTPLKVAAHFTVTAPDKPGTLSIVTDIEEAWHIYSITQAKGGPLATRITFAADQAFELAGDFTATPKPEVHTDEVFPGIKLEEHRGQVTWSVPIRLKAGVDPSTLQITGKVTAQACHDIDKNCLPPKGYDFTAGFKPSAKGEFRGEQSKVTIQGRLEPATVAPGGKARLILSVAPDPGFYFYAHEERPADSSSRPTLIVLSQTGGFAASLPTASAQPLKNNDTVSGKTKWVHREPTTWTTELSIPKSAKSGDYAIGGLLAYQVCDENNCRTGGARFAGVLTIGTSTDANSTTPLSFSSASYSEALKALEQSKVEHSLDLANLPLMIGFSLLGGMILNLMPCVLPVIGLKILSFVEQSGHSRGRVLALNLWYTLGMLAVFTVLATAAVSLNLGWGQQFQSTSFNVVMSGIVFAMALSFLGVWEIPLPGFVGSGAANNLAAQEGVGGAFFKGVLTTVLATPCSGPFLGPVFGFTLNQPPVVTYIVFLCIGLGMASPYLVIGAFPRMIKFLPKPGAWMDTFKQLLAFVLLGTVVFMFSFLKREYVVPTFGMLVAIWAGCWWIGRTPLYEGSKKLALAWGQGLLFAAALGIVSFALLGPSTRVLPWKPYTPERLAQLTASGKTVMVDFTAEWCLTCKLNLKYAIDVPDVKQVVDDNGIVPLLADWTDESEEIKLALESLGSNSIPVLAIFPAGKPSEPIILRDLISSRDQVIEALRKAGPSQGTVTASASPTARTVN